MNKTPPKIIFFLALLLAIPTPLYPAPNAGQVTREVDQAGKGLIEKKLTSYPKEAPDIQAEKKLPKIKDRKVFIKKIDLVGCKECPEEDFSSLLAKYEGREVLLSELFGLAKTISGEYRKKGIVANVFFSPEDVKDGAATLRIAEAMMGELIIKDNRYFNKKLLKKYWDIARDEILYYDDISECIQKMNQNPDRKVRAVLSAGSRPGTTDVTLESKTRFPAHVTYNMDNDGTIYSGVIRQTIGVRHNNLLGLDDMLLAGYGSGLNFASVYAYHNIPINTLGTYFLYGFSRSTSQPKKDYEQYDMSSLVYDVRGSIHQSLYRRGRYIGELYCEFQSNDKVIWTNDGTLNKDKLRMLNIGGIFLMRVADSVSVLMPAFTQGLGRAFGASSQDNPYASNGAKPMFSKFAAEVQHVQNLPLKTQEIIKLNGQYSPNKLTPQEQFGFGGMNSVRGYSPGDYYADNAILANFEFLVPCLVIPKSIRLPFCENPLRDDIKGLLFVDYGLGGQKGEDKYHDFMGVGAGLRIRLFNQATIRLEWGAPMWSQTPDSRFYVSINFQDNLPEELGRMREIIRKEKAERGRLELR